ncbi:uncharacterized protein C8Q71DRAFT_262247 [Rhodofomes roseus]|uniref:Nitrogen regulatory protein areA GATA-like domain-containing protein n=1 Tax=Rhodofomes roseus TaxID=34475 RepID=A0ABQ8K6K2_9APHY|nr:uncharacterized protein C8Q71DRAFT_262247 [Rhodofomes roseus]KAH9832636.1 hypothetical protein C8Q71DRAFT_262247 [Rhodofomes roseus]
MPMPVILTSYLPVLLVSVTHSTAPDDSSFSTLPEGQVDYLSHEWREEDVWRSWRSMTRQKNAIANGTRLENASWRTWWKQRNKLKTISPETLNWLKDSDVTWLYGPLHIGADWSPTASRNPESHSLQPLQRQNSMSAIHSPATSRPNPAPVVQPKKPILKRRSISQLLSLPTSPWFEQGESDEEDVASLDQQQQHGEHGSQKRPPLLHTKSDTHISLRGRAHRKDSPPRIIAQSGTPAPATVVRDASAASGMPSVACGMMSGASSDASQATSGSDPDLSGGSSVSGESPTGSSAASEQGLKKKHISFNTFVEQCIAIEKPDLQRQAPGPRRSPVTGSDDGYDEDSEVTNEDEDEGPMTYYQARQSTMHSDSDDDEDEDDVLEMRTASSRSRTSSAASTLPRKLLLALDVPRAPHPHLRPPLVRRSSTGTEHVTIAPIAPTMLKGTGVGNNLTSPGLPTPVTKELELVYAPPSNSNYSLQRSPSLTQEDVYRHRESYFSVGTSPSPESRSPLASPPIATVNALPPPPRLSSSPPKYEVASRSFFPRQTYSESPMHMDTVVEDTFDYFDGPPVLNENYTPEWQQGNKDSAALNTNAIPTKFAEGGAESVQVGRSSGLIESPPVYSPTHSPETPVVVVNEVNGAMEERTERSREPSPSQISSDDSTNPPMFVHTAPVAVPRIGTTHPQISFSPHVADSTLLSPNLSPCRGRTSASPTCGSVSGSTTTGSSSYSRSTDSRSESRGRSLTRSASLSDCERSSSRGTSSPIGSLSPTGSALALGGAVAFARGRDRGRRMGSDESDRGRDRTGRALAASVSPPGVVNSPTRAGREASDSSTASVDVPPPKGEPSSPPSSVSGSSTASTSTARPSQAQDSAPLPRIAVHTGPSAPLLIPSPIPEEEEIRRLSHPTPVNSPVNALKASITSPGIPVAKLEPQPTTLSSPSTAEGEISASSPIAIPRKDRTPRSSLDGQQDGTFVGRAADMVSSARGLLGSIWNTGTA